MSFPLFCPNPRCVFHHPLDTSSSRGSFAVVRIGSYQTKVAGPVQRYKCSSCGKTFSDRTFLLDYYTKKSLPYQDMQFALCSGQNLSSIARFLHCSPASVQNRFDRLCRNGILFHQQCLHSLTLCEPLCADGYERFDQSQYHPNNINILVGKSSQFMYAFSHTLLRRKGRMRPEQKLRRDLLDSRYKPPRGSATRAFSALLAEITTFWNPHTLPCLELYTDENTLYPSALRRVPSLNTALCSRHLLHIQIPSSRPRTLHNPLFSCNYIDRELTKDLSAYHRESVCFVRNVCNGLSRLFCYLLYHNYCKEYRIRWGSTHYPVHAVLAGLPPSTFQPLLSQLYQTRLFFSHYTVSSLGTKLWCRGYPTPLKTKKEYLPKYAQICDAQGQASLSSP